SMNSNSYSTHIAPSKKQAIEEHSQNTDNIQVYCDGSGHQGNIGAAAVLFRMGKHPCVMCYYLGKDEAHTVFEAEVVGLSLAAELITTEEDPTFPLSIFTDNQAAIQSGEGFYSHLGAYLIDHFCSRMKKLARKNSNFKSTVRWVPGHSEVHGNDEADKHAKKATEGHQNNSTTPNFLHYGFLLLSISALKAAYHHLHITDGEDYGASHPDSTISIDLTLRSYNTPLPNLLLNFPNV
ncbi:ribonuclease H-like protein, partial [Suillus decipiens]